jgi:hypothetical protein
VRIFPTNSDVNPDVISSIVKFVENFLETPLAHNVRFTSYSEIERLIRHLQLCKAAGPFGIQNLVLQHLPRTFPNLWPICSTEQVNRAKLLSKHPGK